jgi:hypothetical protein
MAGERCAADAGKLFLRHAARFIDKAHDETIYPAIPMGADEARVFSTIEKFYAHHVGYKLTHQWIANLTRRVEPPFIESFLLICRPIIGCRNLCVSLFCRQ